jgi:hypothetical protein
VVTGSVAGRPPLAPCRCLKSGVPTPPWLAYLPAERPSLLLLHEDFGFREMPCAQALRIAGTPRTEAAPAGQAGPRARVRESRSVADWLAEGELTGPAVLRTLSASHGRPGRDGHP